MILQSVERESRQLSERRVGKTVKFIRKGMFSSNVAPRDPYHAHDRWPHSSLGKISDSSDTHEISRALKSANLSPLCRRINRARRRAARRVSLIRCVGASWRRVTNDNAAVTFARGYCQLDATRRTEARGYIGRKGRVRERARLGGKGDVGKEKGEDDYYRRLERVYDARERNRRVGNHRSWVSPAFRRSFHPSPCADSAISTNGTVAL